MLATTSMWWPSRVSARSSAWASSTARRSRCLAWRRRMRSTSSSVTFIRSVPLAPSRMTRVPSAMSRTRGSIPATAGMSSARARIATCEEAPPAVVQKPTTLVGSSATVSDGVRSSATRIGPGRDLGLLSALAGDLLQHPLADVAHVDGAPGEHLALEARPAGRRTSGRPCARRMRRSCPCRSRSSPGPAARGRAGSPGGRRRSPPCRRRPGWSAGPRSASSWTMDRSMASLSRRRSRWRSLESSVTSKSSCRICTTVPTPSPGEAATPSSTLGSSERRRGAGATGAGAGAACRFGAGLGDRR